MEVMEVTEVGGSRWKRSEQATSENVTEQRTEQMMEVGAMLRLWLAQKPLERTTPVQPQHVGGGGAATDETTFSVPV